MNCNLKQVNHFLLPSNKQSFGQGNIFTSICHSFCPQEGSRSTYKGACIWVVCIWGSLHPGGLHPGGSASRGLDRPSPLEHYRVWSTSGQYASYWNTFWNTHAPLLWTEGMTYACGIPMKERLTLFFGLLM